MYIINSLLLFVLILGRVRGIPGSVNDFNHIRALSVTELLLPWASRVILLLIQLLVLKIHYAYQGFCEGWGCGGCFSGREYG